MSCERFLVVEASQGNDEGDCGEKEEEAVPEDVREPEGQRIDSGHHLNLK